MAFTINLKMDNTDFPLVSFDYSIQRDLDHYSGKPAGTPKGGEIRVSRLSTKDHKFYTWSINTAEKKSGSISFAEAGSDKTMKTLTFENGYITQYSESCAEGMAMQESFVISAEKIKMGDGPTLDRKWSA